MRPLNQRLAAFRALHRDAAAFLTHFLHQFGVLLTRPLILASLLTLVDFLAEAILLVSHDSYVLRR